MARIRSIKPELPQSASMGRVSREARLCFVLLFTLADDVGRLRAASRMLASLLYPYDDDAKDHIDGWLAELEREKCIQRYIVEGDHYIQITNWLSHQKIDHASKSKLPGPEEDSRDLARPREPSWEDQGSRIKDQGLDQGSRNAREPREVSRGTLPAGPSSPALSDEFQQFVLNSYPQCTGRRAFTTALHTAAAIVETGQATEADLWRRLQGYIEFVAGGGVSGPERVYTPQNFFTLTGEDPPCLKEWTAPRTRAEQQQDANASAVTAFLNRNRSVQ